MVGSILSSIILDTQLHLVKAECGCLQFHRKKECVHTTILFILAVKIIDQEIFKKIYRRFNNHIIKEEQNKILNKMASELKTSSGYFRKINLFAEISNIDNKNYLSLRISYDKEYVVKSITEFIQVMENHEEYTYRYHYFLIQKQYFFLLSFHIVQV